MPAQGRNHRRACVRYPTLSCLLIINVARIAPRNRIGRYIASTYVANLLPCPNRQGGGTGPDEQSCTNYDAPC
jgi:hypothetical protein